MTPSEIAKFYLRFYSDGTLSDNAPTGAQVLHRKAVGVDRQKLLWRAVDTVASKKPVPKPSDSELYGWLMNYPGAADKVADWMDSNKNKVKFWYGVGEAWRAEFLTMADIVHKHLTNEGAK